MGDRRWVIVAGAIAGGVAIFAVGLLLGAVIASSGGDEVAGTETSTTQPGGIETTTTSTVDPTATTILAAEDQVAVEYGPYGLPEERAELLRVIRNSGVATGTEEEVLAMADEVCYHLERLQAQGHTAAYAVRVVWNVAIAPLESEDLATFGTVFVAAPHYLCPESAEYAEEVSYWLGY
jgi:hypothetical protein